MTKLSDAVHWNCSVLVICTSFLLTVTPPFPGGLTGSGSALAFCKWQLMDITIQITDNKYHRIKMCDYADKPTLSIGKECSPLLHIMEGCLCSMYSPCPRGFGSRLSPWSITLYISYRRWWSQFSTQKQSIVNRFMIVNITVSSVLTSMLLNSLWQG